MKPTYMNIADGYRRHGHRTILDRFDGIEDPDGCWIWTGSTTGDGYGQVSLDSKMVTTHRLMYLIFIGEIADGLELDHLCRNRLCGNPRHLEAVTHRENYMRSPISTSVIRGSRTHCKRGHLYDEANTYYATDGSRVCRACQQEHVHKYRLRKKQEEANRDS